MLFQALGVPSALSYACFTLLQAMVETAYGGHTLIHAVFLDDLKSRWTSIDRVDPKPILLCSDFPSSQLIKFVNSTRLPIMTVLDDFEETALQLMEARDIGVIESVRIVTRSLCTLETCRADNALNITSRDARRTLLEVMTMISTHFGLSGNEVEQRTLDRTDLARCASAPFLEYIQLLGYPPPRNVDHIRPDGENRTLLRRIAAQYKFVGADRRTGPIHIEWPSEVWMNADRSGQSLLGPIEMAGPARYIIYGPYLHLPVGHWKAEVGIFITGNISGNQLSVDIFSEEILGAVATRLPASGAFSFSIMFRVVDPFAPIELRFQLAEGAIEGEFVLRSVAFESSAPSTKL